MDAQGTGLRERTRRAVQAELQQVALDLFLTQGFEATTVDQIASAAGLSRRSFHRYFTNKEAVLAHTLRATGQQIAASLTARPAEETPWQALRRAFDPLVEGMEADGRALQLTRLMVESSALQTSHAQKQSDWREAIADALARRPPHARAAGERSTGTEADRAEAVRAEAVSAQAVSAAALACLMTAQAEWVRHDGEVSLALLVDLAMDAVAGSV